MTRNYDFIAIEAKWRERWREARVFQVEIDHARQKYYGLEFFPYPSGYGLSVGHFKNYAPNDAFLRYKAMCGFNVLHPMGWDAFGQPAENEAIKLKRNPRPMVAEFARNYRRQTDIVGMSYDWNREFSSSDPEYYRWTQWLFLRFYERGLAYRAHAPVNWCPADKTVLANEEVVNGRCWRCDAEVVTRQMPQWFFRITAYADRLLSGLDTVDWPEGIKAMQRNWIGKSFGAEIEFPLVGRSERVCVYTTRPDTLWGATFMVLAPEHPLVVDITSDQQRAAVEAYVLRASRDTEIDRMSEGKRKTGVWTGASATNPVNGEAIPVWIADYVMMGYGTGAIMAVPAHDQRDFEFARAYGLPIVEVYRSSEAPEGPLRAASSGGVAVRGPFVDLPDINERVTDTIAWLTERQMGCGATRYKLRDWLISRQRYWGAPIPIVHCPVCGDVPVRDSDLPVLLPDVENYQPSDTGESPLATIPEFVQTACPRCGTPARRETDTMGGFACSSWYFLRFADPHNAAEAWAREAVDYWLPVDMYVGGAEHAVMHLLYARFWTKFLHDEGYLGFDEPFQRLRNQGNMLIYTPGLRILGEADKHGARPVVDWKALRPEEVPNHPADQIEFRWSKMSKSKGNIVTPDEITERYGADSLRVYEMFVAAFEDDVQWKEEGIRGSFKFLNRVWRLVTQFADGFDSSPWRDRIGQLSERERELRRKTHLTIAKVGNDLEGFRFNTAIAAIMEWSNLLIDVANELPSEVRSAAVDEAIETLILLLAPFAPHMCDELWELIGRSGFLYRHPWPASDPEVARAEEISMVIQVNGKVRDRVTVPVETPEEEVRAVALARPKIVAGLAGKEPRRVVVIPRRLVNIVV